MATLMKLQISGIRSFGPHDEHAQQLKFGVPVTLILGQNGCGKTTIIESLKYVCSGELPLGSGSGQGFVNDPKMSRSASTKGHIKLKFRDPRGNEVTVSRVVEVIQRATTMTFASKNATIRKITPQGVQTSISGRCVDITKECCQLMNVSSSILSNVIFCHQENSLWPLDEGKKLKEKFDEIFDAQKYNKCTESLRKDMKDRKAHMKVLTIQLGYNKDKKEQVEKLTRSLEDKTAKLEGFDDNITTKNDELKTIKTRMNEILDLEHDLAALQQNLATKKERKNGVIEEQNTIKRSLIFEFDGTDEELQEKIDSFQKDTQKEQNLIADLEARKIEIESKNKVIVEVIQEAQTDLGILKEQKNQCAQKCEKRTNLINTASNSLNLNLKDFNDNDGARRALYELKMELETQEMCLVASTGERETEELKLQELIDKALESKASIKQNWVSKLGELGQCEAKIEEVSNELSTLTSSDSLLEDLKKRIENIDRTVYNLRTTFKEAEENKKVETYKQDIVTMENRLDSLDSEHRILQKNDVIEGKMETEKRTIMEKQKEINRLKSKHSDSLKQLFDGTVPEKNLKDSVTRKQTDADILVKNLTNEITNKQKEVTTLEVQRNNQREKISNYETELKNNRSKIAQACSGRDFTETLNSTFQKKERLQLDKGQYNSVKIIYDKFIKKFEEQTPCCPVCDTDFTNKTSLVQKIISNLKSKLNRVPQELARVEAELKKEETLYNKLQQLKLVNDDTQALENNKLPELKQELEKILQDLNRNLSELKALKSKLSAPQKIVELSNKVISDVGSLDQNQLDVEKSEKTIDGLKQSLMEVASKKSKHEIEAEIDTTKFEVSELRSKIETTTKNINNHKDRIQQLMQERKEVVEKQVRLKESIQSKPHLEEQKNELSDRIAKLKEATDMLQTKLTQQEGEFQRACANKETVSKKNKQETEDQRKVLSKYSKMIEEVDKLQQDIDDYEKQEIETNLSRIENKLKEYRSKEDALEATKTKILDAISEKKENLAKEELRYRTLQNNVILRERKVLETQLESEIQTLNERIGGYDYRTVFEEKQRLEKQRAALESKINNLKGERSGLLENLLELRRELDLPENKKAYPNYMAKLYELRIAERIMKDIEVYIIAVEKAVLEFHKAKMVQINRTIRNLWRNTYRGNDIDHIEIKTEYATGANMSRRSYNYKVVQIKKGIELDMRGRCSAGQKVLACLLIRMALAETLSSNCGILALDEPTTNLDRANVLSLSDTIARIISTRHKEKSFQLLIITHDEEFLNALTRAQGVQYYYKVDRDKDGYSVITSKAT